jgi:hypothetical protein
MARRVVRRFGVTGALGGLAGLMLAGIQRAAILRYDVPKESFVPTATAIALFEDAARLSVKPWRDRELPPPDRDRRRPPTA